MLNYCVLGTSGMVPLPDRHLSSCMFSYNGVNILIDAGEGTQIAIKKCGISLKKIDYVLFTHYHTDHVGGLPGLLASIANSDRTSTLTIVGPKGVNRIVEASKKLVSKLPYIVKTIEIVDEAPTISIQDLKITPFPVEHTTTCFGYKLELSRFGKCDPEKAEMNDVPVEFWDRLQKDEVIQYNGRVLTKDLIVSYERKGIKVVYTTDTRPCDSISQAAKNADLLICEGMYGDSDQKSNAEKNKHMMMQEAAALAAKAGVKKLILTHYSPSVCKPEQFLKELQYTFSKVSMGYDGLTDELVFSNE
ncbi:MAG: ribonuclease Z [Clostridium sp.]|nr:ribonuclease Z [Clostridium sp.]MCM1207488.1 ribonuclease Z [Ruminococcus sp.]